MSVEPYPDGPDVDLDEPFLPTGGGDAAAPHSDLDDAAIDDLVGLHQALRKLQVIRSRINEQALTAQHEHELIDECERAATAEDRRDAAFWEGQITAFALRRRQATNGRVKSIPAPHGRIETKALPPLYERNEEVLLSWAADHGFVRERVIREVDWAALKKRITPHMAGSVLLDGQEVPGVTHRERPPTVEIVTWE